MTSRLSSDDAPGTQTLRTGGVVVHRTTTRPTAVRVTR